MKLKIALLQLLPSKNLAEQFMIGKKACKQAKTMVDTKKEQERDELHRAI